MSAVLMGRWPGGMAWRGEGPSVNWPVALYTAGIWLLVVSIWLLYRSGPQPESHARVAGGVAIDLLPGFLLALLLARLL